MKPFVRTVLSLGCLVSPLLPDVVGKEPEAAATGTIPVLVLEDQFEKRHDLAEMRGDVVVLIYGDKASAPANRKIGEQVHIDFHPAARGMPPDQARRAPVRPLAGADRAPEVRVVAVACIGPVPAVVRAVVRNQFRKASPEVPVWLDFQDAMKKQFGLRLGVTNLVVVDAEGRVRHAFWGRFDPNHVNNLIQQIEALRREAANPS